MRTKSIFTLLAVLFFFCASVWAQDKLEFGALGASYDPDSGKAAGNLLYAHKIAGDKVKAYSFNLVDFFGLEQDKTTKTAFTITPGIAICPGKVFGMEYYLSTGIGPIFGSTKAGFQWTNAGALAIPAGKVTIMPNVRWMKSTIDESDLKIMGGILIGFGK